MINNLKNRRLPRAVIFSAILLLSALLSVAGIYASPPPAVSAAETQYALVSENGVYLYANAEMAESDRICILPKTYYVKIDTVYADYYSVFYMEENAGYGCLFGYVKKSQVNIKVPLTSPYYYSTELTKLGTPKLHTVSPDDPAGFTIAGQQRIYYYGNAYDLSDNLWYYVIVSGKLGYVLADQIEPFEIPPHPDSVAPEPPPPTDDQPTASDDTAITPGSTDNKMQIFLIIAICIPAIIIVFLLFRGSGRPPKSRYRDTLSREKYPPYDKDNFDDE